MLSDSREQMNDDLTYEITKPKKQNSRDIVVYDGASFDSSLVKAGRLIDQFHLFINPAAIGIGLAIFKDLSEVQKFMLADSIAFNNCEIIVLRYEPVRRQ